MLVDVILLAAPLVAAAPAAIGLLVNDAVLTPKARLQKRLYATLLMAEKLPDGALGAGGVARDIDRQTLGVAYAAQYPERARELRSVALIGASVGVGVAVYYLGWWLGAALVGLLVVLGAIAVLALLFERALLNFERNDLVARELFEYFDASPDLFRPRTDLAAKVPALTVDEVFRKAADVRDARLDGSMTTLAAVNAAMARAHANFDWRRAATRLFRRVRDVDYVGHVSAAYHWLLRRLLGPFFGWRLRFLDDRERRRVARAHRSGDVFAAAWLAAHYRAERERLARHWNVLVAAGAEGRVTWRT